MGLEFKAKDERRLAPGVHLVSIKDISIARQRGDMALPLQFTDPQTGEEYGAIEILFMDSQKTGLKERFYLGEKHQWILNNLVKAIGFAPGETIDKDRAIGCKLWVAVAQCLMYENQIIRVDHTGAPVWYPKMLPEFWSSTEPRPMLKGNPQDNHGICGEEFRLHQDSKIGFFTPTPQYISRQDLPDEGFGAP